MKELWKRITGRIWRILFDDLEYILLNYVVANIPVWSIRKVCYLISGMKLGKHARISMKAIVMRPSKIRIGENTVINEHVLLDGRDGLEIGANTNVSMFVKLYSGTHKTDSDSFAYVGRKTVIGDNCWIGTSAIVMPGSDLKDFVVIGANSVFKGETQEKGIYVGVPATFYRERSIEDHYKVKYRSWFR